MTIEKIENYIDDERNANVTCRINTETNEIKYEAIVTGMLTFHPNMPPRPIQANFSIEAESLEDAFSKYQELAQKAINEKIEEIKDEMMNANKRIIDPSMVDMSQINILGNE